MTDQEDSPLSLVVASGRVLGRWVKVKRSSRHTLSKGSITQCWGP